MITAHTDRRSDLVNIDNNETWKDDVMREHIKYYHVMILRQYSHSHKKHDEVVSSPTYAHTAIAR